MATYNWPANIQTGPVDYAVEFDVQITAFRNGGIKTFGLPGARWTCSVRFENDLEHLMRPRIEAMLVNLAGGAHRLSMPHWGRPIPNGTLRGSPTVASAIAAGAQSMQMTNCNGNVKAGDILGLPGQFVMVMADASPIATNMTIQVKPAIRAAHNSGTPVVWNKPTTLWIPRTPIAGPFPYSQNKVRPAFSFDFVECWS